MSRDGDELDAVEYPTDLLVTVSLPVVLMQWPERLADDLTDQLYLVDSN